ncbi:hypothetical protein G6L37_07300 [Agrobacterium rubi]|nr:hypothetical protein [Agrobacterium rubi]NTF25173.1 hypothetical protein [Agrobacterium rubi]
MTDSPDDLFHRLRAAYFRGARFAADNATYTPSDIDSAADEYASDIVGLSKPKTNDSGWRSHDGSGDPDAAGDTLVEVCFRDGDIGVGVIHDWDQNWQWAGSKWGLTSPGAIVAWRPYAKLDGDIVAVPRQVVADLYQFFHQAWEGTGRITSEGSHGKDLLDWREIISGYHRRAQTRKAADEKSLPCVGTGKVELKAARWEVQRPSDGEWVLVTQEEAKRFTGQGRAVRALYPSSALATRERSHAFTLTDIDLRLMAAGSLSIGGSHQQMAQEILHLRSASSTDDHVAVPRDRLLKLLEYAVADYVPNTLFSELHGYLGMPDPRSDPEGRKE